MASKKGGGNNYIAEWFGHRVYPVTEDDPAARLNQMNQMCPFLSDIVGGRQTCVKSAKSLGGSANGVSRGVCTISSTSNGDRQDWLACPYRALDPDMLEDAARRLFGISETEAVELTAVTSLADPDILASFKAAIADGAAGIAYFQSKLGGEISVRATARSPELNFDATMVRLMVEDGELAIDRYAIFEIQTMDFHGTYKSAVENLSSASHLHKNDFPRAVLEHPEWLSEGVEGPNIANAFKRTFYQMMFKFQIGAHGKAAGCVLAIPEAVWDSWQRFLGAPELTPWHDGTWRMLGTPSDEPTPAWIYVFDLDQQSGITPNPLRLKKVIGTTAGALSHFALDVAPEAALEAGGSVDRLLDDIRVRLGAWIPEFKGKIRAVRERRVDKSIDTVVADSSNESSPLFDV